MSGIHWVENDYPAALARAKAEGKPIFLDVWATWCHSCLSMKRFVFADPGMGAVKDAVVWASIDQELPANRAVISKFPVEALPTFLALDPKDESVIGRWLGSGSVSDLRSFVEQAAADLASRDPASPLARARKGDEAQLRGELSAAVQAYEEALAQLGKKSGPFRPLLLVKLMMALHRQGTPEALQRCVKLGLAEMAATGQSSLAGDFAQTAAQCGSALPKGDADGARVRELALERLRGLVANHSAELAADDVSDALSGIVELYDELGRHPEALQAAQERKQVLLAAQKAAPDAEIASTFDPHLAETLLYLHEAKAAEALLAAREKEMPDDFNPPVRLASVLLKEEKLAEAEQAVERALKLAPEGPRRAGVLQLKQRILKAEKKPLEPALREELALLEKLPAPQKRAKREKELREILGVK